MKRHQLTENLYLDEYIPKELYMHFSRNPLLLIGLIDRYLVRADQLLRDQFGPVTINNWWNDGDSQWSGIRTKECPLYSPTSQHTFGRASDKLFASADPETVRKFIKKNFILLGITCIEQNVDWVHSDTRTYSDDKLLLV